MTKATGWHDHHIEYRVHGGSDALGNRVLLHPNCHTQVHSTGLKVLKPAPFWGFEKKNFFLGLHRLEPCAVKVASTVLRGNGSAMTCSYPFTLFVTHSMSITEIRRSEATNSPKVGFVSLGCPKALVDSEQILTQLRAEGYDTAKSYDGADLVIVNTCGFIDAAVQESLDAIGEALAENGKVIVTGCLGAKKDADGNDMIQSIHPKVLEVTGPHASVRS
jgi:hypothetical protein